jgi:sorting nexin-9/18/33
MPQHTGEWLSFPSFPQSLLGGKSLNRFSNFVTSGAEAFILNSSPIPEGLPGVASSGLAHPKEDTTASQFETVDEERSKLNLLGLGEGDRHFIDTGPSGPVWRAKIPTFTILVHSPSKRMSPLSPPYTMYSVTSLFSSPSSEAASDWVEVPDPDDYHSPSPTSSTGPSEAMTRMTVQRRFSHFVMLHTVLCRRLPGIALPPLPEKQYAGRFSSDFIEARRGDLERYLIQIVRHPIVRYAEILTFFLSCENEDVRPKVNLFNDIISSRAQGMESPFCSTSHSSICRTILFWSNFPSSLQR